MSDVSSPPTVPTSTPSIISTPTVPTSSQLMVGTSVEQKNIMIEEVIDPATKELTYCFECPHCECKIQVPQSWIACTIFRHGIYKGSNGQFLPPHAPKEMCDKAVADGLIIGCGKPFKFNGNFVEKCDYI